eukprot:4421585-Alexandrium_andersonii.AAC.1
MRWTCRANRHLRHAHHRLRLTFGRDCGVRPYHLQRGRHCARLQGSWKRHSQLQAQCGIVGRHSWVVLRARCLSSSSLVA